MRPLLRLFGFLVLLATVGAAITYERPLWVQDQGTHWKLWRAGVRGHYVKLQEGQIHFLEAPGKAGSSAVPLLLVHGLGGRAEDFGGIMPRLAAQGFHVYALDLLGYGQSAHPDSSDYSITSEEHIVTEFMDAQKIAQADVVGWSMGGWIALKLTLDAPQRVRRLAVYDSAGIVFDTKIDATLFSPKSNVEVARLVHAMSPTMKPLPDFVARDVMRRTDAREWVVQRSMAAMKTGRDVVDPRLPSMQTPLLLLWGVQDAITPLSVGQAMHAMNPRSTLVTVDGCGHFGPVECAAVYAQGTARFFSLDQPSPGGEEQVSRSGESLGPKTNALPK